MKLRETGKYVAAKFDNESNQRLVQIQKEVKVPFAVEPEKLHATIHFSPNDFPWFNAGPVRLTGNGTLEVWDTSYGATLVLVLDGPIAEQMKRRHEIGMRLGAGYTHANYIPHITLSYDVGKRRYQGTYTLDLTFHEYSEPLDDS